MKSHQSVKRIPDTVSFNGETWKRGAFLGKGGFAMCFQVKSEAEDKQTLACKIVSKKLLVKSRNQDKMNQEINIHKDLNHENIVKYIHHFHDENFVYVILEYCQRRSLADLLKRRRHLTIPETQYFMLQILKGVDYLHTNHIVHRDLKVENIFLNEGIQVKIGDFGLATQVNMDDARRMTICGTPNYIAPEVLSRDGHSFEVDMWSVGCIIYTLLIGRPPFEMNTWKETCERIKKVDLKYNISVLSQNGYDLLKQLLILDPQHRYCAKQCLEHPFLTDDNIPLQLPDSIFVSEPTFDVQSDNNEVQVEKANIGCVDPLHVLDSMLKEFLSSRSGKSNNIPKGSNDNNNTLATPAYWITKWVDYTDKYGLGYQLCDDSIAVLFKDKSRLVMMADEVTLYYIDKNGKELFCDISNYPDYLQEKLMTLKYFIHYMKVRLVRSGDISVATCNNIPSLPYLRCWFYETSEVVFYLSNGTLQINFLHDHTKIVLCPTQRVIYYIDKGRNFHMITFKSVMSSCSGELSLRLTYAAGKIDRLRKEMLK